MPESYIGPSGFTQNQIIANQVSPHMALDGRVAFSLVPGLYAIHSDFGFQEHGLVLWAGFRSSCFGRVEMWVEMSRHQNQ